jgi:hypothetical protein
VSTFPTSTRGVLDTSTVILLRRIDDPSMLPAEPVITAVTSAELSVGPLLASDAPVGPSTRAQPRSRQRGEAVGAELGGCVSARRSRLGPAAETSA